MIAGNLPGQLENLSTRQTYFEPLEEKKRKIAPLGVITGASGPSGSPRLLS